MWELVQSVQFRPIRPNSPTRPCPIYGAGGLRCSR